MVKFRISIDSREQQPYMFGCSTIQRCLDAGDYSVDGLDGVVAVERKSLADFAKTVIHDRERFEREMEKLQTYAAACIVVEADLDPVLRGACGDLLRGVSPASLLGASLDITLRRRVPVFWCGSRQAAREFTEQYLRMCARLHAEGLL